MPRRRFSPIRNSVMAGLLALSCTVMGGTIAPANLAAAPLELTAEQMLQVAGRAVSEHRPQAALALTDALLDQSQSGGFQLWLIRSRAHRDLGQADTARMAAGRAWDLADTPKEKFTAALIMAQAQSSSGNRTLSQIWLRRAAQHAETEQQKALIRRDFRYVRDRNPWRVNLSFGAAPSSNINGGSSEDQLTLFGLPFGLSASSQALSGTTAFAAADLSYRLSRNEGRETWIGVEAYQRQAWLSSDAKAQAPDVPDGSFDYGSLALTLRHDRKLEEGRKLSYSFQAGRNWYGGQHLSDFASAQVRLTLPIKDRNRLRLAARLDYQVEASDRSTTWVGDLSMNHLHLTEAGNGIDLSLGLRAASADDVTREYREVRAGARWIKGAPVFGAHLSLGLELDQRDYDVSYYRSEGRHDRSVTARAELRLPDLSQFGFSPTVSIEHRRTQSNIELFTSNRTNLSLGFSSDF